jgi:uridylate kinase
MENIVISLGGSVIIPDEINTDFLKRFKITISDFVKKGNKVIIVCGGGKLARRYSEAAKKIMKVSDDELDWIGIKATILNAELVKSMFGESAYEKVVNEPNRCITTDKKIIIGSGWKPGWSTDYDAVLLAKQFGAKRIINLSNIEYVYDKDPKKYNDAKKITDISWSSFQKIVGIRWKPSANLPFDPIATKLAKQLKLKVIIAKGTDIANLKKILNNRKFKGTVIQ